MDQRVVRANTRLPPELIDDFLWLQKCYEQSQEEYRRKTFPYLRLVNRVKQNCRVARVDGWRQLENVWVWEDVVAFELERASWHDVPGSDQWLAYLRKMYVVDAKRGRGYGSQFVRSLQEWCQDAGAAVCLVSVPFGFSKDSLSQGAYFLNDLGEVFSLWESGEIHCLPGQDLLRHWYLQRGFLNVNLLDEHFFDFKSPVSSDDQFIFMPESVDDSAKLAASHRLTQMSVPAAGVH
jgi:GNAT superfamily N-acetyltransferase